ncbi:MAG: CopG family transcriptional regulator [Mesoaciditoga sp.]|uniref:TM1266 family iron-only hydrogenase system putative regulator n=1 Tax=Athalassotoga sp. TaxID=2022597 RepID=UPI000CB6C5BB|nr:MAG: CopG family transcriptional regulator [Mesoaciditoga sp.]PMP80577.1 MAG: CopG family transcriptional regulator [Mesoaciditoga sp.]HEU24688.1 CopG family transcriptional regulator [Mesoaciditoga lauensis]
METTQRTNRRLGVVAIVVKNREESYSGVNEILHDYGNIIIGRMGIPYRDRNLSIISVIVDGTTDEIGAMTGKLGKIKDVSVKSMLTSI